jgi:hypothetical protein
MLQGVATRVFVRDMCGPRHFGNPFDGRGALRGYREAKVKSHGL